MTGAARRGRRCIDFFTTWSQRAANSLRPGGFVWRGSDYPRPGVGIEVFLIVQAVEVVEATRVARNGDGSVERGGYHQELKRAVGSFQVFAIFFAFISVAVSIFGTYDDVAGLWTGWNLAAGWSPRAGKYWWCW